ncbi:membrane protein [Desulfocucumis palustris]|uniref:Membrane protein n=1 Tax=Desulfocucumis palustris TaxID=1898651 RepID=A0A2L2XGP4_9FIRM|nr:glycosyltransferase family 39 protein [Desulfocucumis palustris]GBF35365.1 membrane protein [Desulfocucumis palustris]
MFNFSGYGPEARGGNRLVSGRMGPAELAMAAALTVVAAIVWYLYYDKYFIGLTLNDAMDYAGIARNVAEGEGFISQYLTPLSMAHQGVPQPDMWRAPLWPLALALFQKVFGFIDEASALGTGFFYVLTVPVMFLLARLLFNNAVAVASVLLYIFSPQMLNYGISGMTESMSVFFMALVFLALLSPSTVNRPGDLLLGVIIGLFYLTRYNALLFLPFIAVYRAYQWPKRGFGPALRVALGFLLAVFPWFIRNTLLFGNPLFSLQKYEFMMFTESYPDYVMYVLPHKADAAGFLLNNTGEIIDKVAGSWNEFLTMSLTADFWGVTPVILLLFLLPVFLADRRAAAFKALVAVNFIVQLAALLVIHFIPRLFLIFTPLVIIAGVGSLMTLLNYLAGLSKNIPRRKGVKLIAGSGIIIITGAFALWNYFGNQPGAQERTRFPQAIFDISRTTSGGDLVITNEGHMVSWYGNRYAVKIPYSIDMIPEMEKISSARALFISNRIFWHMPEVKNEWKNILYNRPERFYGFRLYKVFSDGGVLYLKE